MDSAAKSLIERLMEHLGRVRETADGDADLIAEGRVYAGGCLWTLHALGLISDEEWQDLGADAISRLGVDPGDMLPL